MSGKIKLNSASGGGSVSIQAPSSESNNRTLTLPSDADGTIVSKDASNNVAEVASINGGALGTKNLVLNGDFNIFQRGSARAATSQGAGYATADRWKNQWNNFGVNATETITDLTSSDTPYSLGFRKYLRFALAAAGTAAAGSYIELSQLIEAQNLATSGWNYTSSSSDITLQFWFRCSTNQTFYCSLQTADGTVQAYVFPFTATGNNTWTKITHTISGNSNITFDNNNQVGLYLRIIPYFGTTYSGTNVTNNSWVAFNTDYVPDMATTWLTAGASTFDLTAVQLEVGSTASLFVHETYADTLRKCQRYYFVLANQTDSNYRPVCNMGQWNASAAYGVIHFPVQMRTPPSLDATSASTSYVGYGGATGEHISGFTLTQVGDLTAEVNCGLARTQGDTVFVRTNGTGVKVAFQAEL